MMLRLVGQTAHLELCTRRRDSTGSIHWSATGFVDTTDRHQGHESAAQLDLGPSHRGSAGLQLDSFRQVASYLVT